MDVYMRPSRSDVHMSREEAAKIEQQTKDYFDGVVPKRHTKPQRSEYASQYVDAFSTNATDNIPELVKFQNLENHPQKFACNGSQVSEEFVETEYYKDLNRIDKQHHTTGTGFITMDNSEGKNSILVPDTAIEHHGSCKGNPATNDWIPAAFDNVAIASDKPNRSEN